MIIGLLVGMLIGGCLGALVGAIILRAAAKWVEKTDVPFGSAFVTTLIILVTQLVIGGGIGFVVGSTTHSQDAVNGAALLMWPVGFCIQSGIISARMGIAFGRACLVSLAMLAIGISCALLVAIPVLLIIKFAM